MSRTRRISARRRTGSQAPYEVLMEEDGDASQWRGLASANRA
jgi:hypothetical protein